MKNAKYRMSILFNQQCKIKKKTIQFEVKLNSKEMQILMLLKMQILHRVLLCKLLNFPISIDFQLGVMIFIVV